MQGEEFTWNLVRIVKNTSQKLQKNDEFTENCEKYFKKTTKMLNSHTDQQKKEEFTWNLVKVCVEIKVTSRIFYKM